MAKHSLENLLSNGLLILAVCAVTLALAVAQAEGQGTWKDEWDRVVAAAKKEGKVVIYSDPGREQIFAEFEAEFPGIKTEIAAGNRLANRILAERRARKFIPDINIGGASYNDFASLRPTDAYQRMKSALILPEVLDESQWFDGKLWFADEEEKYILMFSMQTATKMAVNTNLVNLRSLTSYKQVLDPKWRGKIVSPDVTRGGQGSGIIRYLYMNPHLGPDFLRRLFGEMDITLSREDRQMMDWLGRGRFAFLLFPAWFEVTRAKDQGLPVENVNSQQMKEGFALSPGPNTLQWLNPAPHPNAAKLFINWFLSRDGQRAFERVVRSPSLRGDTPKKNIPDFLVPKKGANYMVTGLHKYAHLDIDIRKLLASLQK
jgi:iron(III) transport system substrate-binding protein